MVKIKIENIKTFLSVFEGLEKILDEAKLKFTKNGLVLNEIDDGRIILINSLMEKEEFFSVYELDEEFEFGVNLSDFVIILKRLKNYENVVITRDILSNKLVFNIEKCGSIIKSMGISHIDIGDSGIKPEALDSIEYGNQFSMKITELNEIVKDCNVYSETIPFKFDMENLIVDIGDNLIGSYINFTKAVIEKGEQSITNLAFPLEYVKNILKVGTIYGTPASKSFKNADIKLSLQENDPMILKMVLKGFMDSHITFDLAPRIEDNNEEDEY